MAFAKEHPRWSWKRAYQHRRREGHRVNKKRVQRLWRAEDLKVSHRKRKQPLRGLGVHIGAMSRIRFNVIRVMNLQFDETRDGRQLKLLDIQDILTGECLAVEVARSITGDDLMNVLDRLVAQCGSAGSPLK
ncbi:MAG: transposase [Acidobacteria bacterium]|nr:transposase [Acidobacteriota bacterium]